LSVAVTVVVVVVVVVVALALAMATRIIKQYEPSRPARRPRPQC
jgi:hypothetical protein